MSGKLIVAMAHRRSFAHAHAQARLRRGKSAARRPISAGNAVLSVLLWVAAVALLFEEWFWPRSTRVIERIGEALHLSTATAWIRRRPPLQALALFVIPVLVLYPFKVLALIALANGDIVLGGAAFVAAKLIATAVFARLYELTEPALVRFAWIHLARKKFLAARAYLHTWLNGRPAYRRARSRLRRQSARLACRYRAAHRQADAHSRSARPANRGWGVGGGS